MAAGTVTGALFLVFASAIVSYSVLALTFADSNIRPDERAIPSRPMNEVAKPHPSRDAELSKRPGFTCQTTKGEFEVELDPVLAPKSTDRILDMIKSGYFDQGIAFFRVNQWITQFGADHLRRKPDPFASLRGKVEQDVNPYGPKEHDPGDIRKRKAHPWKRGTWAWIGGTQMIIVRKANAQMGTNPQDAPAGTVVRGMDVIDSLDHSYGNAVDSAGQGPDQVRIMQEGNDHIHKEFPNTDFITKCVVNA
mmetsp:Transcript_5601/g.13656  ORF Transcript_5601/g.13656 Transcript_5601/m.13656 type:complete len:250 (+) Transcript_5601:90-839(+)|eukprot:CAMPEP_0114496132 /NCGR_PEP_ID=MMETSP0109-20121206/5603_1 /TAXON_ID=29199 /ORGANISM="Chlorarachnion reptans, Strain CCCM449" /LENGTH=249 /DNA_ID=CAMNT_0001673377 /DNA_START=79 /DNA_END=828 /DNA_ORIENTATION=-